MTLEMKEFLRGLALYAALALGTLLACSQVFAQTTVPVVVKVNWVNPTTGCSLTPCDNVPLTGAAALTKTQIWASTASIAGSNTAGLPSAEVPAPATSHTFTTTGTVGGTIFVRLKSCNAVGCSVLSNEVSKTVQVPIPGIPTGVTIVTITIAVDTP